MEKSLYKRLKTSQKRFYKSLNAPKCEISGEYSEELDIHHIKPICNGGNSKWDNLMLVDRAVHQKLHNTAYEIAKNTGEDHAKIVEWLSLRAMELCNISEIERGVDPNDAYKREIILDFLEKTGSGLIEQ